MADSATNRENIHNYWIYSRKNANQKYYKNKGWFHENSKDYDFTVVLQYLTQ